MDLKFQKKRNNFADISPERRQEIAAMGGRAVPKEKRSYSINRDLAVDAGAKGGRNIPKEKRMFSKDRALAARAGAVGGSTKRDKTSSSERRYRKVRCKTSHGFVVSWGILLQKDGKWRISTLGSPRLGNSAVPISMLPFALSNVVMGSSQPEFDNFEDAERYVRAL